MAEGNLLLEELKSQHRLLETLTARMSAIETHVDELTRIMQVHDENFQIIGGGVEKDGEVAKESPKENDDFEPGNDDVTDDETNDFDEEPTPTLK